MAKGITIKGLELQQTLANTVSSTVEVT